MTDNEIIKALECCARLNRKCNECPLLNDGAVSEHCISVIRREALYLIKRQQAEIERAKAEFTRNEVKLLKIEKLHNEQKAIADSRKLDMDYFINENERLYSEIEKAKSEAIREFVEKLKEKASHETYHDSYGGEKFSYTISTVDFDDIDQTVDEMDGETS